jgi:hypothetical protein
MELIQRRLALIDQRREALEQQLREIEAERVRMADEEKELRFARDVLTRLADSEVRVRENTRPAFRALATAAK